MANTCNRLPCAFFGHGGGPMPLLGQQPDISNMLKNYVKTLDVLPTAVLVVTAHWVADTVSVSSANSHSLLYDYGGFPPETYTYKYPAPGSPALADKIAKLLGDADIPVKKDAHRGWDHGVFVPLMLMFPDASIPVVAISLHSSLNPEMHISVGRALAPLREEGVLIIGSGMSFHNFKYFFARDTLTTVKGQRHSHIWNNYLQETLMSPALSREDRLRRLADWAVAPSALEAHPLGQEDHLLPLHVLVGAAGDDNCHLIGEPAADPNKLAFSNFEWK